MIPYGRQSIDDEDIQAVIDVLKSDFITTGPKIGEFEKGICNYTRARHALVVNSGTSALDIAVQALELPCGSEIITTPLTFAADANAALYNNCKPVFADIETDTRNINPEDIRSRITEKTKAIIIVDYAGHPCELDEIREIADEHDLWLIEDACHALGAEYKGNKVGSLADMTILSFHPVKHITTGEGGAVLTERQELYDRLKLLRTHGIDRSAPTPFGKDAFWAYDMVMLGRNYRITDFQCILGLSQLKKLDQFLKRRNEIAHMYNDLFISIPEISIPETRPGIKHAWHIYTVLLNSIDRTSFAARMKAYGIGTNVHYIPTYKFSYYRKHFKIVDADYPVTEDVFSRIVTLPLYPSMDDSQVHVVVDIAKKVIKELNCVHH
jgi:UDP-4-amino-4,6-dideoxy-N-acetyl-beta-L-altrosamine transaminase